jgi:hypothetical protein
MRDDKLHIIARYLNNTYPSIAWVNTEKRGRLPILRNRFGKIKKCHHSLLRNATWEELHNREKLRYLAYARQILKLIGLGT